MHELLVDCEMPDDCRYIWEWFLELNSTRQYSDTGHPKLTTFTEILSWSTLMAIALSPNETSILHDLDKIAVKRLAPKPTTNK